MRVSAAAAHASTYGSVADPCIHAAAPGGEEEAEGMACAEEDGEDECPFLGDDPLVVLVVVGVVEEGIERCGGEQGRARTADGLQRTGRPYSRAASGILLWRESRSISGETMAGGDLG